MADRMIEANYEAMISALTSFASNVTAATEELQSIVAACRQGLSEEDEAIGPITADIGKSEKKYYECCKQALFIAKAMEEELEAIRREREAMRDDSDGE